MKALILDGSHAGDPLGERVSASLTAALTERSWETEHVVLRDRKIGNCAGDFFCWIRTPGICNVNDDNRDIAASIVASDLLVYLTPVRFGGYSSVLKRMVDHQIQNISPFFATVDGETHHAKRYARNPDFLAIGWMETPDRHEEAVFRSLVHRNALNFRADGSACGVVTGDFSELDLDRSVQNWLDALGDGNSIGPVMFPAATEPTPDGVEVHQAALLIGSPRTGKSTSNSLGGYLFRQLEARGIRTETIFVYTSSAAEKMERLLQVVEGADLVTLAFPLYVDSLSAPATELLERIAERRQARGTGKAQMFAALVNCGFPEEQHMHTAVAICRTFARRAGFEWAGALALGGGQGIVNGVPLTELGSRAIRIRKSLDMAAGELARGRAIPAEAQALMSRPVIPAWLYRLLGHRGWKQWAREYGAERKLNRRPYETGSH